MVIQSIVINSKLDRSHFTYFIVSAAYGSSSALFPAMNSSSMAAMQNAILSGFCPQPPMEAMRGIGGNGARSPTNVSDNSDNCDPSSPETSMSLHPALPGQVSFDHTNLINELSCCTRCPTFRSFAWLIRPSKACYSYSHQYCNVSYKRSRIISLPVIRPRPYW